MDLQKHFEAADKEKSGLIDFNGLQSMIHSIGKCDSSLAREFVHIINNSKEKKCSLAQLQSIVDSVKSSSIVTTPPLPSVDQSKSAYTVPSSLAGHWKNELNSKMVIYSTSPVEGQFNGLYKSAVGHASGWYPLVGRYDPAPDNGYGLITGWTVQWNNTDYGNSHSNTVWSGQYFHSNGEDYILTSWLLSSETTFEDYGHSLLQGKDNFAKTAI